MNLGRINIPVFFHNFVGYDQNLILPSLSLYIDKLDRCFLLGKSSNKINRFDFRDGPIKYTFKDSLGFIKNSIENIAKEITFTFTPDVFKTTAKGLFPYDWFDTTDKLSFEGLPEDKHWYNVLQRKLINPQDLVESRMEFLFLGFKIFKEWLIHYNKLDVYILAEFFEKFRDTVFKSKNIDPTLFHGAAALAWNIALIEINKQDFKLYSPPYECTK